VSIPENVSLLSMEVATGDDSEWSTTHSATTLLDMPATSYLSANDQEAKKTGMYKLSGKHPRQFWLTV